MSLVTPLRTALKRPASTAFGFWLTLPSTALARTILRSIQPQMRPSWVLIDGEHGLISEKDYYELSSAVGMEGASPIIRLPENRTWMIKRALDSGAHGILVPMCHTVEDAKLVVEGSKYPPTGTRGYGPLYAAHSVPGLPQAGPSYDDHADNELLVMVQIESQQGLENVEAIAKTDGIDVLLIGPFDLAKQTGLARGGESHEAAIQRILKAAKSAGKKAAIFCTDGDDAQRRANDGFDMVSVITDMGAIAAGFNSEFSKGTGQGTGQGTAAKREGY